VTQMVSAERAAALRKAVNVSAPGTFETCRLHRAMSAFESNPEDICSHWVLLSLTRSRHIELSKAVELAHTWGCRGMGRAFGFAFLLPLFLDGAAHYQFLNFIRIRLIAISFKPLLALAVLLTGAY
jgi:hypothetical protein